MGDIIDDALEAQRKLRAEGATDAALEAALADALDSRVQTDEKEALVRRYLGEEQAREFHDLLWGKPRPMGTDEALARALDLLRAAYAVSMPRGVGDMPRDEAAALRALRS